MAKVLFDDKKSVWHALLGFISAFTLLYSIIIITIFTIYQIREREDKNKTLGDFIEFVIGYIYGLAVLVWFYIKISGWWLG